VEDHPVRAGSVVARPPRTRLDHAFRAGTDGMKLLANGTREPNDIAWYPRSKKVYFRGVGLMTRCTGQLSLPGGMSEWLSLLRSVAEGAAWRRATRIRLSESFGFPTIAN
jgi:hypothetical protein